MIDEDRKKLEQQIATAVEKTTRSVESPKDFKMNHLMVREPGGKLVVFELTEFQMDIIYWTLFGLRSEKWPDPSYCRLSEKD